MTTSLREASAASPAADLRYRRYYVWHWPIRAMHWTAAACIVVLACTGFYIGKPYFMTSGEASSHFLMGWVRFVHFAAAGILVATAIVRVYWLFNGNRYETWRALFPVSRPDWHNLGKQVRAYLFLLPERAPMYIGHNPLQQMSYTALYAVAAFQVVTGFALYGLSNPSGTIAALFGWVGPALGGVQVVRFWHHIVTWVFAIFVPVHVYLTFRADITEPRAGVSAMINGSRYLEVDKEYEDASDES